MKMKKENIRSIRYSDEIADLIDQQVGANFQQKFERLVYNAYMMLPSAEKEHDQVKNSIAEKRKQLRDLEYRVTKLRQIHQSMEYQLEQYEKLIAKAIENLINEM